MQWHFNPRLYARGDGRCDPPVRLHLHFNPRLYARGDSPSGMSLDMSRNFNPRLYARGDTPLMEYPEVYMDFNPRLYARGDGAFAEVLQAFEFQSTPLRERRRCASSFAIPMYYFNPRLYARGDGGISCPVRMRSYFNPRLYARGDMEPALYMYRPALFQSTPLRERRRDIQHTGDMIHDFNPRLYARGDELEGDHDRVAAISIHASTREATPSAVNATRSISFQSTPLRERRR